MSGNLMRHAEVSRKTSSLSVKLRLGKTNRETVKSKNFFCRWRKLFRSRQRTSASRLHGFSWILLGAGRSSHCWSCLNKKERFKNMIRVICQYYRVSLNRLAPRNQRRKKWSPQGSNGNDPCIALNVSNQLFKQFLCETICSTSLGNLSRAQLLWFGQG